MRLLLLSLLLRTTLACAEPPWWERQGDRYVHPEGWTVPIPTGYRVEVDGDSLDLTSPDGKLRFILTVFDSQTEVEEVLSPLFADMQKQNGGQMPVAHRSTGRTGLQLIRRTVVLPDRQVGVVHILKPGAHLVALYHAKDCPLPDLLETVTKTDVPSR